MARTGVPTTSFERFSDGPRARPDLHPTSVLGRLAQIKHTQKYNGGRTEYLGVFEDEREAAEAYDAACRAIGRHASVNFPLEHDATGEVHAAKALLGLLA